MYFQCEREGPVCTFNVRDSVYLLEFCLYFDVFLLECLF